MLFWNVDKFRRNDTDVMYGTKAEDGQVSSTPFSTTMRSVVSQWDDDRLRPLRLKMGL